MIYDILMDAFNVHNQLLNCKTTQASIQRVLDACILALKSNAKIIFCGNGGSFADAQHITAEFVGRFMKERNSLPALCLGCNLSSTTAIGNDYAFDTIFSRELHALGRPGDVLIGISTSGNSPNVLAAIATAKERGIHPFGLTGNTKGKITSVCPCIEIPSNRTPRIQECHILVGHVLCELIDEAIIAS
jgi:D-sedoheptulose 7-phosphate isomerase